MTLGYKEGKGVGGLSLAPLSFLPSTVHQVIEIDVVSHNTYTVSPNTVFHDLLHRATVVAYRKNSFKQAYYLWATRTQTLSSAIHNNGKKKERERYMS